MYLSFRSYNFSTNPDIVLEILVNLEKNKSFDVIAFKKRAVSCS